METFKVPLPAVAAEQSATATMPPAIERQLARFTDIALEAPDWPVRAAALNLLIERQMDMPRDGMWRFKLEATAGMLTSMLEQLGEREITSLPQAMLYRFSVHAGWREAAMRWLRGAGEQADHADWMMMHPALGLFAVRMASLEMQP